MHDPTTGTIAHVLRKRNVDDPDQLARDIVRIVRVEPQLQAPTTPLKPIPMAKVEVLNTRVRKAASGPEHGRVRRVAGALFSWAWENLEIAEDVRELIETVRNEWEEE